VNEPEELRRLGSLGVDGICTDFPDVARAAVEQLPHFR
jgi:glycerophosphoryl diester phosphodiesterase